MSRFSRFPRLLFPTALQSRNTLVLEMFILFFDRVWEGLKLFLLREWAKEWRGEWSAPISRERHENGVAKTQDTILLDFDPALWCPLRSLWNKVFISLINRNHYGHLARNLRSVGGNGVFDPKNGRNLCEDTLSEFLQGRLSPGHNIDLWHISSPFFNDKKNYSINFIQHPVLTSDLTPPI